MLLIEEREKKIDQRVRKIGYHLGNPSKKEMDSKFANK